jgi:hypothetical protein
MPPMQAVQVGQRVKISIVGQIKYREGEIVGVYQKCVVIRIEGSRTSNNYIFDDNRNSWRFAGVQYSVEVI